MGAGASGGGGGERTPILPRDRSLEKSKRRALRDLKLQRKVLTDEEYAKFASAVSAAVDENALRAVLDEANPRIFEGHRRKRLAELDALAQKMTQDQYDEFKRDMESASDMEELHEVIVREKLFLMSMRT